MTANEMKFSFMLKFDALFEFSAPAYDDRQISYVLTNAQTRIFLEKYYTPSNKFQRGFEADEKRRRDLEQLIKQASWNSTYSELLTNPDIAGDADDFIFGGDTWTYMNDSIGVSNGTGSVGQTIAVEKGSFYRVEVHVDVCSSGSITPKIGDAFGSPITSIGKYVQFIEAETSAGVVAGIDSLDFSGVVGYISVRESDSMVDLRPSDHQVGAHKNGKFFDLPDGFLYAIEEAAITTEIANKEVLVKPVTHDQYLANINNPYKRPYSNLVWRMDYSRDINAKGTSTAATAKRTELITNPLLASNSLTNYRLRYLQMPPAIIVDEFDPTNQEHCVLDETLHESIVDEAVKIANASVKPQEYQISSAEADTSKK